MAGTDPLTGVQDALTQALGRVDRREPLGEAQIATLEAVVSLLRAGQPRFDGQPEERAELLCEALGAVRAATMATGIALTYANQRVRQAA
jgi:hypothetical protein